MMDVQAIIKDRFDKVFTLLKNDGFAENIHPEESKIRLEQEIKDGQGQYIFKLNTKDVDGVIDNPRKSFVGKRKCH